MGQTVTALYELVPAAGADATAGALEYQTGRTLTDASDSGALFTVHVRFKRPGNDKGEELAQRVLPGAARMADASADFRFAAALAGFGMMLRNSEHKGGLTWKATHELAATSAGGSPRRRALVDLIARAAKLSGGDQAVTPIATTP